MAANLRPIRSRADYAQALAELELLWGAEVLNRKRGISLSMIRRLHDQLGIPAELLIRPTRRSQPPNRRLLQIPAFIPRSGSTTYIQRGLVAHVTFATLNDEGAIFSYV